MSNYSKHGSARRGATLNDTRAEPVTSFREALANLARADDSDVNLVKVFLEADLAANDSTSFWRDASLRGLARECAVTVIRYTTGLARHDASHVLLLADSYLNHHHSSDIRRVLEEQIAAIHKSKTGQ